MKTYLVICQPYERFDLPQMKMKVVKAKGLIDLIYKFNSGELFEDVFDENDPPLSEKQVIEGIEGIDISGFDGYAIFEIKGSNLKRIADCGLFDDCD